MAGLVRRRETTAPIETRRAHLTTDLQGAIAAASPARLLQQQLAERTSLASAAKWSARRRLGFIIASASGLWLAVISAGVGVVHAVA